VIGEVRRYDVGYADDSTNWRYTAKAMPWYGAWRTNSPRSWSRVWKHPFSLECNLY